MLAWFYLSMAGFELSSSTILNEGGENSNEAPNVGLLSDLIQLWAYMLFLAKRLIGGLD